MRHIVLIIAVLLALVTTVPAHAANLQTGDTLDQRLDQHLPAGTAPEAHNPRSHAPSARSCYQSASVLVHNASCKLRGDLGLSPGDGMGAHHIAARGAGRAAPARAVLDKYGIDVDSATNGVALPRGVHRGVHTNAYYDEVNAVLSQADSREEAIAALDAVRLGLVP